MNVAGWTSRILVNAVIGLTRRDPSWPSPFEECGWHINIIEPKWVVDVPGEHQPAAIRPDVVLASNNGELVLVTECKCGSVQADQLARYLLLDVQKLRDQCSEVPIVAFRICYFTTEPRGSSSEQSLHGSAATLVVFGDERIALASGALLDPCLDAKLTLPGIDVSNLRPPTRYIPFDVDAPAADVIPDVVSTIIRFASEERASFDAADVVRDIFDDIHPTMHRTYRGELERPVKKALGELVKPRALGDVLTYQSGMWSIATSLGKQGGLQYRTAVRRATEYLSTLRDQTALDI